MVRFRLLCGDFLLPNQQRTLKTERPSAWDTRRWPRKGEPENAAGRGQEIHAGRTAHPTSCVQNEHMRLFSLVCIHADKLSAWILFVLRLTSTWHFVKPRWNVVGYENRNSPRFQSYLLEVVNGQIVHLPLNHNRGSLVGDHFDHQPDNRNTLLCESGDYHFVTTIYP